VENLSLSYLLNDSQLSQYRIRRPHAIQNKSTVYNQITGFYSYEGKIEFDGQNITGMPPYRIAKAGIAYFGESHVLRNVAIAVKQGEVVVLLGPHGHGKSTLLKSI
jgi:ABC-type branched-subunit amino acid transport system ATPase component